jgi:4-hydroxy-tetrahydrodipicolinate synthase
MITPLIGPDTLDVEGTERLIEHILDGGVHGIFILGTTGEAPSLSYRLRSELIDRTCKQVAGRVPVLVGITDASMAEMKRVASYAADAGANALVVAAPFYYPIEELDLLAFLNAVVPQLPLPTFLYNMPTHTKINFSPALIRKALDLPNVVGLKDSAPGASCFHAVRNLVQSEKPDFSLLIGPEELMSSCVQLGAHGGVCGGANLFPKLFVDLYTASSSNDRARVVDLQAMVMRLAQTVYASAGGGGYASIRAIKRGLSHLKICSDRVALPLRNLSADEAMNVDPAVDFLFSAMKTGKRVQTSVFVNPAANETSKRTEGAAL